MPKKNLKKGVFITFEGVEGCGKSSHSKRICRYLKNIGYSCIYTREPGGTRIGNKIRKILLNPENITINDITELFLFEANRSQVMEEVIKPGLKKKMVVISDRFFDATVAYQGYGSRLNKIIIKKMNTLATGGVKPDLTVILDLDVKKGLRRTTRLRGKDRMEKKKLSYHNRVRKGYKDIAKKEPGRVKLIPTKENINQTQELIKLEVLNVLRRYKTTR